MTPNRLSYTPIPEANYQAIVASLMSELDPIQRKLDMKRKCLIAANTAFSLALGSFSIFLNKQQALALCTEDFHWSANQAIPLIITNSSSNLSICAYTSSELFMELINVFIGKNKEFYQQQRKHNKTTMWLIFSLIAGFSAALPVMVTVTDPKQGDLAFTSSFILASYSFFTLAQSTSNRKMNALAGMKRFSAALNNYEQKLRGDDQNLAYIAPNIYAKLFFMTFIPLGYIVPFLLNNILIFNNPDYDLRFLNKIFPENKEQRLISAIAFASYCTLPWFILAAHFGYHLPDVVSQQINNNPFSKLNPVANLFLQILQVLISAFTWAIPVKFFLNIYKEFFITCDDPCISLAVLFAGLSGILYVIFPNMKVT